MTQHIDLNKYKDFVAAVTSKQSNEYQDFLNAVNTLKYNTTDSGQQVNPMLLMTASIGLSSETGEFNEIVKKMFFQGKPFNDENHFHLKRELGDIIWYWTNACRALGLDPNDVIVENVRKLETRYPDGNFDPFYSENRKEGDL
jgi:NTP pyrophosphatase (non-canonical NTP hydrolase)